MSLYRFANEGDPTSVTDMVGYAERCGAALKIAIVLLGRRKIR